MSESSTRYIIAHNGAHSFGGGEKWTALLLAELQERGYRVLLLCGDRRVAERARELGAPTMMVRLGGDLSLHDALRFARLLRRERPDVLLLTTFHKIWLGGLGARLARVPRVFQSMRLFHTPRRWKYRVALRHWIHVTLVNAEAIRRDFLTHLPELGPHRVQTLYDGVPEPKRTGPPGKIRRSLGLPDGSFVVGTVSRIARQKRLDRLVEALARLPSGVHAVVAGEGEERPGLEALAESLGVRPRLHFLGYRTDVGNVLDAFDLFMITSDYEGMANAMLEAMAIGLPVVSTPVHGADEALDPFPDGVAPGAIIGFDASEIAAAIERVRADPALRRAMGEAARRRIQERFSFDRMVDRFESLMTDDPVHAGPPPPARSPSPT